MRTWRAAERLRAHRCGNCKIEFLTATMCSCIRPLRCLPPCSFTTEPVPRKFSAHNKIDLRSWTDARGGIQNCVQNARWVATTEALLPLNASTAKALCTFDLAMAATADSNYYRGTGVGTEWENFLLHFAEYHSEFHPFLTERLWKLGSYFPHPVQMILLHSYGHSSKPAVLNLFHNLYQQTQELIWWWGLKEYPWRNRGSLDSPKNNFKSLWLKICIRAIFSGWKELQ